MIGDKNLKFFFFYNLRQMIVIYDLLKSLFKHNTIHTFLFFYFFLFSWSLETYKVFTSPDLPGDKCDPVWCSGEILVRQLRGPGFNPQQVLIFSLSHLVRASLPVHHHKY